MHNWNIKFRKYFTTFSVCPLCECFGFCLAGSLNPLGYPLVTRLLLGYSWSCLFRINSFAERGTSQDKSAIRPKMDQRNLTLPTPAATTIMSSSSAAMAMGFGSFGGGGVGAGGGPTTSALAGSTIALATTTTTAATTTTPATFFTYSIPGMDIAPGPFIFTYVSEFLSLITPEELPLGKSPPSAPCRSGRGRVLVCIYGFEGYRRKGLAGVSACQQ